METWMLEVGALSYRETGDMVEVTCKSWVSGATSIVSIPVKYKENFLLWWEGKLSLDQAVPDLTEEEQELILTGIRPEENEYDGEYE